MNGLLLSNAKSATNQVQASLVIQLLEKTDLSAFKLHQLTRKITCISWPRLSGIPGFQGHWTGHTVTWLTVGDRKGTAVLGWHYLLQLFSILKTRICFLWNAAHWCLSYWKQRFAAMHELPARYHYIPQTRLGSFDIPWKSYSHLWMRYTCIKCCNTLTVIVRVTLNDIKSSCTGK